MFKRAAIEQIAFDELIRSVRVSADFYFTLTHLFNGSAIIDARLGGYRIHGKNLYSGDVHLEKTDSSHRMPQDLFTNILSAFVRCVTGSRLEHCSRLLHPARGYPRFLKALQEYASHHVSPGSDVRIVGQAILNSFEQFSSVLGREYTIRILIDSLDFTRQEIDDSKIA